MELIEVAIFALIFSKQRRMGFIFFVHAKARAMLPFVMEAIAVNGRTAAVWRVCDCCGNSPGFELRL